MELPAIDARTYDVIIVGGGPAGLQTALGLARHLWRILVIDSGSYRNDATSHMHNVPGWDHARPSDFRNSVRDQILERYDTVDFIQGKWATKMEKNADGLFTAALDDETMVYGRKVVLATGIKDLTPPISGYEELWGKYIFHCLFCHGYEERGAESAGVLATDGLGNEMHAMWVARYAQRLAARITIHTNGNSELAAALEKQVTPSTISIDNREIIRFKKPADSEGVILHFSDGTQQLHRFLVHGPKRALKSDLAEQLGIQLTAPGEIRSISPFHETSVAGVYAAGDCMVAQGSVLQAMFNASLVTAGLSQELCRDA
ncbi:hypothetical protein BDZ85DRAFT_15744 [Elsinoe ampelina]|uniref:FAD/NAD(P)-binding domain-containing protein n=1 Tax=Elsinoe ampelina TaxID=302913 RepID=A0A6A6G6Y0_9PEZI|nr:hypothetical protein BDZ85DRAFT_15744 [Elsinoe ampelina]